MKFWNTKWVGLLFLIISLVAPFDLAISYIEEDLVSVFLIAPLWSLFIVPPGDYHLFPYPVYLIYFVWFWPSFYITKVVHDSSTKANLLSFSYTVRVCFAILFQFSFGLLFPVLASSGFPPINIPLVVPGIMALILTKWIVTPVSEIWNTEVFDDETFCVE